MLSKIPSAGFQDNVKFRNLIINGGMDIAQRQTSETGITGGGYYTIDRYRFSKGGTTPTLTMSQDTDVPSGQGFVKSLKLEVTTVSTVGAADIGYLEQRAEGQNLQYLKKGTSSAESLTVSFWIKASVTGTYIAFILDSDNTRQIAKSYTISSANTWEKKTITFDGDTTGAFDNDNNVSLRLCFALYAGTNFTSGTLPTSWQSGGVDTNIAVGQVNTFATVNNTWQITGVQLEAGQTASEFEFLPHDVNLERCRRYYQILADGDNTEIGMASCHTTATAYGVIQFQPEMRASPSVDQVSGTNYYQLFNNSTTDSFDSFTGANASTRTIRLNNADSIGVTQGHAGWFMSNNNSGYVAFDGEL